MEDSKDVNMVKDEIEKIDIVFTYVNGLDSAWLENKKIHQETDSKNKHFNSAIRYVGINEIYYSVKNVIKFMPWVNNIFIITDNQVPPLGEDILKRVKIIDHTEIIPAKLLPVFFSDVIESFVHNIPGLSEIFIYSNDDNFFFDTILPEDIYSVEIGQIRLKVLNAIDHKIFLDLPCNKTEYKTRLRNTKQILTSLGCEEMVHNHVSKVLRKSTLKYIENNFELRIYLNYLRKYKFRNDTTIQYMFFVQNIENMLYDNIIVKDVRKNKGLYRFYNFSSKNYDAMDVDMLNKFKIFKCKFVCYNGMNSTYKEPFEIMLDNC